jgi:hypothetical protein
MSKPKLLEFALERHRDGLKRLGYNWQDVKKGVFLDGHERDDVVEYRQNAMRSSLSSSSSPEKQAIFDGFQHFPPVLLPALDSLANACLLPGLPFDPVLGHVPKTSLLASRGRISRSPGSRFKAQIFLSSSDNRGPLFCFFLFFLLAFAFLSAFFPFVVGRHCWRRRRCRCRSRTRRKLMSLSLLVVGVPLVSELGRAWEWIREGCEGLGDALGGMGYATDGSIQEKVYHAI